MTIMMTATIIVIVIVIIPIQVFVWKQVAKKRGRRINKKASKKEMNEEKRPLFVNPFQEQDQSTNPSRSGTGQTI